MKIAFIGSGKMAEALIAAAIKDNIFQAMEDVLQKSPVIKARVKAGTGLPIRRKLAGSVSDGFAGTGSAAASDASAP